MGDSISALHEIIKNSGNIVFFGGAGVSTDSGIPDFRSVDGLYSQKYAYPPEEILSHSFFVKHPEEFFAFYRDKLIVRDAAPNMAHMRLAELEREGKLKAVITQNIDGLHQQAGSRNVLELHGTVHRCYCTKCGRSWPESAINDSTGIPRCDCGGTIRPDVVLYEEGLDQEILASAIHYIKHADVLIVGGTSLAVYPAAGLLNYYEGDKLVLINKSRTAMDGRADLIVTDSIGKVFSMI